MLNTISRTNLRLSKPLGFSHISVTIRNASLNSAIGRGIRRSQAVDWEDRHGTSSRERQYTGQYGNSKESNAGRSFRPSNREQQNGSESRFSQSFRNGNEFHEPRGDRRDRNYENRPRERSFPRHDRGDSQPKRKEFNPFDKDEFIRSGNFQALPREHRSQFTRPEQENFQRREPRRKTVKPGVHRITESMPERVKETVKVPLTIPYTTPASEFIYGTSAVEAALRCSRRQLYKLYIYQTMGEELNATKITMRKLAMSKNVPIKMAFAEWDRMMDKMSAGRPHNGCILEASPLPKLPVAAFQAVPSISEEYFRTELAPQTREEAAVNGTDDRIPIHHPSPPPREDQPHRYPVALLLDGVVDTGNMGAIIRSAYFLGVDAIVLAGRNSAPFSPVTIKASAGAAENMPILHVKNEIDFIQRSQENGWRFYAADAPGPHSVHLDHIAAEGGQGGGQLPIATGPSVVMMGSEESGLSSHLKSHADATVSIPGARHSPGLGVTSDPARIDSLNVSVAAALLMEKFLRTPLAVAETPKKEKTHVKEKMW